MMNAQEKIALQDFLQEMNRVRLERKDLEADAMIRQAAQQQPDALYLLTQRALLQEQALNGAQQQIAALQQQIAELKSAAQNEASGFLDASSQWGRSGHALGGGAPAWQAGNAGSPASQTQYQSPSQAPSQAPYQQAPYQQAPAAAQPQAQQQAVPAARPGLFGGAGGSFLGSMAGVVAGAAAGNFLYQGMEHMLHRNDPQAGAKNFGDLDSSQAQRDNQASSMSPDNPLARDAGVNDVGASPRDAAQWDDSGSQDDWSSSADNGDFLDDGDDLA